MKEKTRKILKAGTPVSMLIIGVVIGIVMISNMNPVNVEVEYRTFKPIVLPWLGDADPGSGASGVLTVVVAQNAQKTWNSSYNGSGVASDSEIYAYGDVNDSSIGTDVPYDTAFEVAIKVRWNQTHAYTDGAWRLDYVNGWANCTDLSISSLECDEELIATAGDDEFIWVWYVADDTDNSGYTISKGEVVEDFTFNFNAYY